MEPLPPSLKIPEVSRFINRANQLRSIKPALAYWCEYHAVNQIVGRSLHTADDASFAFTKTLIERLEATKAERADDDAIVDNEAGQAYVESFANETFARAERALRADKVTRWAFVLRAWVLLLIASLWYRQTADTFDAAATFFDLTREWGAPDAEIVQKIKFAKWNATRILKAIREGKDPNESNPPKPEPVQANPPQLDPDDPSVRQIVSPPPPVTVEDVPDDDAVVEAPPAETDYFPHVPSDNMASGVNPAGFAPPDPMPGISPSAVQPSHLHAPASAPHFQPPSSRVSAADASSPTSWTAAHHAASPVFAPPPPQGVSAVPLASTTSQRDINEAQRHAKWAISALNFDDVPTAVKELRNALHKLGATL
ncbi:hypothetical protein CDD80_2165 [Ophiocordyceps camponoti-rufipedis]|uniref:Vta1 C-terminal domain-containing protein n=1 Tax=Ophiocordyceps camponoti-rufipedis TaxID=2004952 RepID=A0A2C5YCA9_9HYPO|nr:hypothetical protein CDD80_2165 [Ophiocordyceps camponoti-rufipedis]